MHVEPGRVSVLTADLDLPDLHRNLALHGDPAPTQVRGDLTGGTGDRDPADATTVCCNI